MNQQYHHISHLEHLAVILAISSFLSLMQDHSLVIISDNITDVIYGSHQSGTVSRFLCCLATTLWDLCIGHCILPSATHIPGIKNKTAANMLIRKGASLHDWELGWTYLCLIFHAWGLPDTSVFTTRLNSKCKTFCCSGGTNFCSLGDSLLCWEGRFLYLFPPIFLILRVPQKIKCDKPAAVFIVLW